MTGLSLTPAIFEAAVAQVPGTVVHLGAHNAIIDGLDVSWTGAGRSGTGISLWDSQGITVQNVTAANRSQPVRSYWDWSSPPTLGNRYLSNDLSNADWGLIVYQDTQFVASGNNYTGDTNGWELEWMTGLSLTPAIFEAALAQVPGTVVHLGARPMRSSTGWTCPGQGPAGREQESACGTVKASRSRT